MAVSNAADEGGDDDLGAFAADGQHGVVEDAVVTPAGEGFLLSLGETEVDLGTPELFCAVVFARLEEFVGADEAQGVVAVGGHGVLATFAPGEGEERAPDAEAAGEICEQRTVFVVGVGDDHQDAGGGGEAAEGLLKGGGAAVFREGQGNGAGLAGGELGGCGGSGYGRLGRLLGNLLRRLLGNLLGRRLGNLLRRRLGNLLGRLLGNLLRWQAGGESACKNQAGKGRTCCCSE